MSSKMRIAVVGAGASGLASARHVTAQGFDCEVYETASDLGGTWIYTDDIEKDKYGYPIHTAMYEGLRANLPKEVMGFPDFPIPPHGSSFLSQEDILQFLNLYADHFKLRGLIKFENVVTEIRPLEDKWQIKSVYKPSKEESTEIYDAVMICNGHYNTPRYPHIEGREKFEGKISHSHQFRRVDPYKDRSVLVMGAGFSGLDIAMQLSPVARHVVLSHHVLKENHLSRYLPNVTEKPEVLRIKNGQEVEFIDGSCSSFDSVVVCTGYKYNFPFLHESCGVAVDDNCVHPLYKHMIHIEKPTLCFIGVPFYVCAFQLFDIQARFYCQYLNRSMPLPTKREMLEDLEEDRRKRREMGYCKKQSHMLGHRQQEYFDDLAATARLTPIAPVVTKIWSRSNDRFFQNLVKFREDVYRILNNESYVVINSEL